MDPERRSHFDLTGQIEFPHKSPISVNGRPCRKRIILSDVNIPYKLSIDRNTNILFFCINADEFSDQSFHSAVLDLVKGITFVVPGIRNGFASAVDNTTGSVYLGGSDGIYQFNYNTNDVSKPALIRGMDIFEMFFQKELYFVETASQNLYVYRNGKTEIVSEAKDRLIHHFAINQCNDLLFINAIGMFVLPKGGKTPILFEDVPRDLNFRGITTDTTGEPYFISQDGIYSIDVESKRVNRILQVQNGYGLAFDKNNNMVYSDERTLSIITPVRKTED